MHQIVGDVGTVQRIVQTRHVGDIAVGGRPRSSIVVGCAGHRANVMTRVSQGTGEVPADESGGTGDQHRLCHRVRSLRCIQPCITGTAISLRRSIGMVQGGS
jgi:hypothetical protein